MEKHTCENCEHFSRYYLMLRNRFLPSSSGFCLDRINRKIKTDSSCENWQECRGKKEEILKNTNQIIRDTHDRLDGIYKILQTLEDQE